ncbi:D-hexose-6-phosphate mutarotase [Longimicrobium sp.]|uniref:D-hexose-6-phosphate mutarotase n=1 Tax=Longimicrobium sp. TaxID=2029185 RepID=UPI002E33E458|nr:D-hexose-6-phosphate mutarotase [Longimicrobium sp.]HEX6040370.1 D-hexose-6-phosphate mutarotase [Longimicrobium sp.]
MEVIRLVHPSGASAEVRRNGAHVTSWIPAGGGEALFLSRASRFTPGRAIRGGVPVIFPQFAEQGPLPKHGFARTEQWDAVETSDTRVVFRLRYSMFTRAIWPHRFAAELAVELEERRLAIHLSIRNVDSEPFSFTSALHTYLRVADVGQASVAGLRGLSYRDKLRDGGTFTEDADPLRIPGEIDRVYVDAPRELRVRDEAGGRTIVVHSEGFADAVIWNPGADKAAAFPDMEAGEEREMLCVEAAQAAAPVTLAEGETWEGAQVLEIAS